MKKCRKIVAFFLTIIMVVGIFSNVNFSMQVKASKNNVTTIYYANDSWSQANIHYKVGNGNWTSVPGVKMEKSSEQSGYTWKYVINLGSSTNATICFNNGNESWDSRNGRNYSVNTGIYGVKNQQVKQLQAFATSVPTVTPTPTEEPLDISIQADVQSPQKTGTTINFNGKVTNEEGSTNKNRGFIVKKAETGEETQHYASPEGNYKYSFSWTPQETGTYTISFFVSENGGRTGEASLTYKITDTANTATIYYANSNFSNANIHYKVGNGNWTSIPGVQMEKSSEMSGYTWKYVIDLGDAENATVCFNNGSGSWDSKNASNYTVKAGVSGIKNQKVVTLSEIVATPVVTEEPTATPTEEPTATPTEEPTATPTTVPGEGTQAIIYYANSNFSNAYIHYKVGNGSWTTVPGVLMEKTSEQSGYTWKYIIELANSKNTTLCFNNGSGNWDSKNASNYTVKAGVWGIKNQQIYELQPVATPTPTPTVTPILQKKITKAEWIVSLLQTMDCQVDTTVLEKDTNENIIYHYGDISTHQYANEIETALLRNYLPMASGSQENFEPDSAVTREFAAMTAVNALGVEACKDIECNDVSEILYKQQAYYAVEQGMLNLKDNYFYPNRAITEEEQTQILKIVSEIRASRKIYFKEQVNYAKNVVAKTIEDVAAYELEEVEQSKFKITVKADALEACGLTKEELAEGKVIVLPAVENVPNGISVVIETVEKTDGNYSIVGVVPEHISMVYDSIRVSGSAGGSEQIIEPAEDVEVSYENGETVISIDSEAINAQAGASGSLGEVYNVGLEFNQIEGCENLDGGISFSIPDILYNIDIELPFMETPKVNEVSLTIQENLNLNVGLSGGINKSIPIGEVSIPVSSVPGLAIKGNLSLDLSAEGSASISLDIDAKQTIGYKNGSLYKDIPFPTVSNTIELDASAKMGPMLNVSLVWPEISVLSKEQLLDKKFSVKPAVLFDASVWLGLGVGANFTNHREGTKVMRCMDLSAHIFLDASLITKECILSKWIKTVEWSIFNSDNSPWAKNMHFEDGKRVPECTWGKEATISPSPTSTSSTEPIEPSKTPKTTEPTNSTEPTPTIPLTPTPTIPLTPTPIPFSLNYTNCWMTGIDKTDVQKKGEFIIPETFEYNGDKYIVTSIDKFAFYQGGGYAIRKLVIPDSVTYIGDCAFLRSQITSVELPSSVTYIGEKAFSLTKLTSVEIPSSVSVMGKFAFEGSRIQNVEIADGITYIPFGAFEECHFLKSIKIPDSVTTIQGNAFYECMNLNSITIPNSVSSIGSGAFKECSMLKSIEIPNGVALIYSSMFENCKRLETVKIPDSVKEIESEAFKDCISLKSIKMSDNVKKIGEEVFLNCTALESIAWKGNIYNSLVDFYSAFNQ